MVSNKKLNLIPNSHAPYLSTASTSSLVIFFIMINFNAFFFVLKVTAISPPGTVQTSEPVFPAEWAGTGAAGRCLAWGSELDSLAEQL